MGNLFRASWLVLGSLLLACGGSSGSAASTGGEGAGETSVPAGGGGSAASSGGGANGGGGSGGGAMALSPMRPLPGELVPQSCGEVDVFGPVFPEVIARWKAQDDLAAWPASSVVFVGSSSIRRWEELAWAYRDYAPLQRGFGGAQLGEVALFADELVLRHAPRAVVVFAGTNDIAANVPPEIVVDRFRCLRERIALGAGVGVPVVFIAITPTIARWDQWPQASAVNDAVAAMAAEDPALFYADVAAPFLETGTPPAASLFVADELHLSASGYALWDGAIRPVVEGAVAATPASAATAPPSGTRWLLDLGPSDGANGEATASPDGMGQHWNNWHPTNGGGALLPGEQRRGLVTTEGAASNVDVVTTGGWSVNGYANGGLLTPDPAALGSLAVGTATGDFAYAVAEDQTGGLFFRGLDPQATYRLRLFAARDASEVRVTTYAVVGAAAASAVLQTSGPGAGSGQTNDDDVATLTGLAPDAWGHLFVDARLTQGSYAYLSALELSVE